MSPEPALAPAEFGAMLKHSALRAGKAAEKLFARHIDLRVDELDSSAVQGMDSRFGAPDAPVMYVMTPITGGLRGHFAFMCRPESGAVLAHLLTGAPLGQRGTSLDPFSLSALEELANIVLSIFLNDLATRLDCGCLPGVPRFSCDLRGAILGSLAAELEFHEASSLCFHADLSCRGTTIDCCLLFVLRTATAIAAESAPHVE